MLKRTHLAIGLSVALYFSSYVPQPWTFIPIVLFASLFPDIDSGFSYLGKFAIFKPIQWTTSHRGIFHSYTLAILLSIGIAIFYPIFALPFFIGYSFHLFADSFTIQGIKPFWPIKFVSKGPVGGGGKIDSILFYTFVIINLLLIATITYSFFQ